MTRDCGIKGFLAGIVKIHGKDAAASEIIHDGSHKNRVTVIKKRDNLAPEKPKECI
jgi:hypothetical protein